MPIARDRRSETAATVKVLKIISGGQTGVDRAALDVALRHGIKCGGWCPAGRLDEFGKIPDHYPVQELQRGGFTERTLQNVKDSDGTVVIYPVELRGGTKQTIRFCIELKRTYQLIDASKISAERASELIADFVCDNRIGILNVAGPRQSEWPEGYEYASRALSAFLKLSLVTQSFHRIEPRSEVRRDQRCERTD
jgi:putative molybdenum carrier protein